MDRLDALVIGYPYIAVYAFCCSEAIAALLIAGKSRTVVLFAVLLAIVGAALIPGGGLV